MPSHAATRRPPDPRSAALRVPPSLPYAGGVVALEPACFETVRRAVALLFRTAHGAAFEREADAGAGPTALHRAGNHGVFMGYDFHVTPAGPRLIEINTNAGGALANGLHTASRVDPARIACLCDQVLPVETIEERIVGTFRAELAAARPGRALRRLAIADERPETQFLYPEFQLLAQVFERAGIEAAIVDTGELRREADAILAAGRPVDLVYLRDTDFQLDAPRSRALREAWLAGEVVVTPSPREHHLLADKRRLAVFSSAERLRALGVPDADAAFLAEVVPETRPLAELGVEAAWRTRREWVFKPCAAFGSRAVYRGDKITRRKLEEIAAAGGFVAQRAVAPGEVEVPTADGPQRMKFDVRAYAYRDEILLLGARVYRGQVTNLRTPGGGFSAICVVRRAA
jgi:hypothetical protein